MEGSIDLNVKSKLKVEHNSQISKHFILIKIITKYTIHGYYIHTNRILYIIIYNFKY